jgi:hypothetical protein
MEKTPKQRVKKKSKAQIAKELAYELMTPEEREEQILNKAAKYKKQNKSNRTKGHSFERDVVHMFRKIFPEARRNLEFQKEAALAGVDLINTGRWRVQCKRGVDYVPVSRIDEVKICPIEAGCPILLTKADKKPILAVLPFDELLLLIKFKERHERNR